MSNAADEDEEDDEVEDDEDDENEAAEEDAGSVASGAAETMDWRGRKVIRTAPFGRPPTKSEEPGILLPDLSVSLRMSSTVSLSDMLPTVRSRPFTRSS